MINSSLSFSESNRAKDEFRNADNEPFLPSRRTAGHDHTEKTQESHTELVPSPKSCSIPTCIESGPAFIAEPERCETNCASVKEYPPIVTKSRPHPHSHSTRSATIVLAIAFHAIIEGLALGVQTSPTKIWAIFISLTVHKLIVAFSIGLQLARTHAHSLRWVVVSMIVIAFMSPIGGGIGMIIHEANINSEAKDYVILVCHGLAVGTFLYVTFFEVLIHERDNEHPNLLKVSILNNIFLVLVMKYEIMI